MLLDQTTSAAPRPIDRPVSPLDLHRIREYCYELLVVLTTAEDDDREGIYEVTEYRMLGDVDTIFLNFQFKWNFNQLLHAS